MNKCQTYCHSIAGTYTVFSLVISIIYCDYNDGWHNYLWFACSIANVSDGRMPLTVDPI